jgi:hypothetical protein
MPGTRDGNAFSPGQCRESAPLVGTTAPLTMDSAILASTFDAEPIVQEYNSIRRTPVKISMLFAVLGFSSAATASPMLFVTQLPIAGDDVARMTIASSFANHLPSTAAAARGGDLMLCRIPVGQTQCTTANGGLRNLTAEAGFGSTGSNGFQDQNAIAVRDPSVNFGATRAAFSMVIGAPVVANGAEDYTWQLYEITNLTAVIAGSAPQISKVANQPVYNNIHPNYLSDGKLVFVSDRPRNGSALLSPIKDEYRGQPANSGLWRLDPATGDLYLLEHTPGGSFSPSVDSFGRLVFVRWDHLMQDNNNQAANLPFDYISETSTSTQPAVEGFPEPIQSVAGSNINGFEINQFFPWMTNQDGSGEETLNHVGRHELKFAVNKTFTNDPNLVVLQHPGGFNWFNNFFQMREDPTVPGRYLGVDAPEFGTHTSGQIVAINAASAGSLLNAENMTIQYVNKKGLASTQNVPPEIGHFRDPLPMSDGSLVASFTTTYPVEPPASTTSSYGFRLVTLNLNQTANGNAVNGPNLTSATIRSVSYFVGANLITQNNAVLWELQPVEIFARPTPPDTSESALAIPEQQAFAQAGVNETDMRAFLDRYQLALVVMRNVLQRDDIDRQQPFNLHVPGGISVLGNPATGGTTYDIDWMQFFQADQVRAYSAPPGGIDGRRTLARTLNDPSAVRFNPPNPASASPGSVDITPDGSVALFVPARRAMTWQSLSPTNIPVVRERYWIEFQGGEIRACDSCHGVNSLNQAQQGVYPQSSPTPPAPSQSLIDLLNWWKLHDDRIFVDGFGP